MKEIILRLKADTPLFFKRLRNLSISVGAAALTVTALSNYTEMPIWITAPMHYCMVAGAIGTFFSQLAKQDNSEGK